MPEQEVISSSQKLYEILHLSSYGTTVLSIGIRLGLTKKDLDLCIDYLQRNRLIEISDSEFGKMVHITDRGTLVFKRISQHF
jgi:hypothetical protein